MMILFPLLDPGVLYSGRPVLVGQDKGTELGAQALGPSALYLSGTGQVPQDEGDPGLVPAYPLAATIAPMARL
jgi:hypothetical protein